MSNSLHVGFLAPDLTHRHGWAHYALSLLLALQRAGVRVSVAASRNSPPIADVSAHNLLPTLDPMDRHLLLKQLRAAPAVGEALRACTLIHSTVEPFAPLAARIAGERPLIVTGHGSYIRASQMRRFPVNKIYERALRKALLVCVSSYTARQAALALPGIRVTVVPNGIDIERFAHLPVLPKDGHTILSVGAVKRRKGTLELAQAAARVHEAMPDVRCVIAGSLSQEPHYVERVRQFISENGLSNHVLLLGRISDEELLNWYARADVFALPSMNDGWKFEGFGLSLLEASAAGLPVIGSWECGAEDAVDHEKTGLLTPQGDIGALAAALIRLLQDNKLRQQMGDAGKRKAARMTWDSAAQAMIDVYRRSLE